jgi:DNA-binding transcriptional ArsR family regulator
MINAMVDQLDTDLLAADRVHTDPVRADPVDTALVALAEPTRRQVVELLGARPHRAGELAERAGTSRAAMSRHLKVLRTTGLVDVEFSETDGRERVYRLRADRLGVVQAWLDEVQRHWARQLDAFAAHAARACADAARAARDAAEAERA